MVSERRISTDKTIKKIFSQIESETSKVLQNKESMAGEYIRMNREMQINLNKNNARVQRARYF